MIVSTGGPLCHCRRIECGDPYRQIPPITPFEALIADVGIDVNRDGVLVLKRYLDANGMEADWPPLKAQK